MFENTSLSTTDFETNTISFFPNPAKDNVNFVSVNTIERISIYNLLGQEVISKQVYSNEFNLDISNLSNSTYVVKLINNNKSQSVKLIKF